MLSESWLAEEEGTVALPHRDRGADNCQELGGSRGARTWSITGDYENRLPRGRTYVRNGSVLDLQIAKGEVIAAVAGSGALPTSRSPLRQSREHAGNPSAGIAPEQSTRWSSSRRAAWPRRWTGSVGKAMLVSVAAGNQAILQRPDWADMCNTPRRRSMVLAPGSTKSPSFSSSCEVWMKMNCSPLPDRMLL